MKYFAIIIALLIIAPSPALAVRKIEKKTKQQSSGAQKVDQSQQPESKENKAQADQPAETRNAPLEIKQPQREDRFIDENSDGINDRIDQRQTVKVRKKEAEREKRHKSDPPKKESPDKPDKKSRRDR